MRKIIFVILLSLLPLIAKSEDGWFKIHNQTIVGMQIGWGPSFEYEGGVRDYTLELYNATVGMNYSKNGRYVREGSTGLCTNPSVFTWTFGYDFPVFTKKRFQASINPSIGWEVKYWYDNLSYTKMCSAYREATGFRWSARANFDVRIIEGMAGRFGVEYENKTMDFSVGIVILK